MSMLNMMMGNPTVVSSAVTKLLTISGSTDSTHKKWNLATSYLGAFRMPNATYGSLGGNQASVNYDRRPVIGLTSSTKFVIGGGSDGDTYRSIGEYNIPTLSTSATLTSLNTEFGRFNIFSMTPLPTDLLIYEGIGRTTSKRQGLANPSLPRAFDRNRFGENDIRIFSLSLSKLYLCLHRQNFLLAT